MPFLLINWNNNAYENTETEDALCTLCGVGDSIVYSWFLGGFRPPEMKLTVSEARTAFEREADALDIVPFGAGAVTRSLDDDIVITPLWNEAVSFSDAEGAYVVVPFNLPLGKIFARKQFDEEIPEDEKFANTDIRLFNAKKHENE